MKWIRDEEFIRGGIPMSKFEARVLAMAMLDIGEGDTFLDIGAGTGSLSVQAAMLGAKVFAVEKEQEGIELIGKNAARFGAAVSVIPGTAPDVLEAVSSFNKCFIGGSGGRLEQITRAADSRLAVGGVLAASFIVPENMVELKRLLKEMNYSGIEARLIHASVIEGAGLMKANNPIFLIKGKKQ